MRNNSQTSPHKPVRCCAICGGKCGLIRYYSWRSALCSKKCVHRFKERQEADHKWLRRLQTA